MKKEINLRTKDYKLPQQIYFSRLVTGVIITMILLMLIVAVIFLNFYRNRLEYRAELLRETHRDLTVSFSPAEEMEREIELIKERIEFENSLRNREVCWTDYINDIKITADEMVDINLISGTTEGSIMIDGKAPNLEKIVVYTQLLEKLEYLDEVLFEYMVYNIQQGNGDDIPSYDSSDSFYNFTIYGSLSLKR